jgi:response regulator RpfG family c-di-GMP phosphodiesterase
VSAARAAAAGARTLLLVDDEERILGALCRSLRREGYRLLTAQRAEEALRVLDAEPVDAILCDQLMPRTTGLELLAEAAARRPGVVRILVTGWPESIPRERVRSAGIRALVPKPWDDAALKRLLREILGQPR